MSQAYDQFMLEWRDFRRGLQLEEQRAFEALLLRARPIILKLEAEGRPVTTKGVLLALLHGHAVELARLAK